MASPLNASGTFSVRTFNCKNGSALTAVSQLGYTCSYAHDASLSAVNDFCITFRPTDEQAYFFKDPAATNPTANVADWNSPGWGPILISVSGGPASVQAVRIEFVVNYEVQFYDGDAMNLAATPAVVKNEAAINAANYVYNKMTPVITQGAAQVERTVWSMANAYVGRLVGKAVGMMGPYGKLASTAMAIADVD